MIGKHRTILKNKRIKILSNLSSYKETYRKFDWKDAEKEIDWFSEKKVNIAYNAVDRHALSENKNKVALYWHGENDEKRKFTYLELSTLSNRFAHLLKKQGVKRGDRVFFFLPRIPQLYYGFLGTLKVGAIAGTLFSAFGEQALLDRLSNSGAKVLVTNKDLYKRLKNISSKLPELKKIIFVENIENLLEKFPADFRCAKMHPKDPAYMLYTSGTTGKPKGVVHCHKAILLDHMTSLWVLDLKKDDILWCTADPGWVTGIAYGMLGPLSLGCSILIYEGRFDPSKWYSLIDDYQVSVWYTAPTAIRMLAAAGLELARKYNLLSLRYLASVGEPLNPDAVMWGIKAYGLPFHDNWWQTETGGILIANYRSLNIRPGSMGKPIPGIRAAILGNDGTFLAPEKVGNLAICPPWPSMMEKIWLRPRKYKSYFKNGWYITGDLAYKTKDGYFWFVGRSDDIIKTSGERVGPFEVESALNSHPAVTESAVIGKPDALRGNIIKAFICLASKYKPSEKLKADLQAYVKSHLAGHAYPREIEFVKQLPKTRSGKIMRRLLRAKEMGLPLGDTSALEEY